MRRGEIVTGCNVRAQLLPIVQLLPTSLHQNHPPSLAHSNNTICNREERTFQVESSLCGERKYIGRVHGYHDKISKGTEWLQLSPTNLHTNCEALRKQLFS